MHFADDIRVYSKGENILDLVIQSIKPETLNTSNANSLSLNITKTALLFFKLEVEWQSVSLESFSLLQARNISADVCMLSCSKGICERHQAQDQPETHQSVPLKLLLLDFFPDIFGPSRNFDGCLFLVRLALPSTENFSLSRPNWALNSSRTREGKGS